MVYDFGGVQVRSFVYDPAYPGRMTGHRYAGRPRMRYRYGASGRVEKQLNPEGLSYRYAYEKNQVVVTDSPGRREVLHTEGEGEGGQERVTSLTNENGSHSDFTRDALDRLTQQRALTGERSATAMAWPDGWCASAGRSRRGSTATARPGA